ncbi:MAG: hypothetical protein GX464_03410 [Holophagae bacterium]|nr:hypothetical protein [Holophagae bacterium]
MDPRIVEGLFCPRQIDAVVDGKENQRVVPPAACPHAVEDLPERAVAERMLREADCSPEEAEAIYRLTSLAALEERFVIPPMHREEAIAMTEDPLEHKQGTGFGFIGPPRRGL